MSLEAKSLTLPGYVNPNTVLVERLLVAIESLKATIITGIHRCILLVPEHDARTGCTLAVGLLALPADGLLFVAFQLADCQHFQAYS